MKMNIDIVRDFKLNPTWVTLKVSGFLIILIDIYEFNSCGSRPKSYRKVHKVWALGHFSFRFAGD